jgi:hypothetical protein
MNDRDHCIFLSEQAIGYNKLNLYDNENSVLTFRITAGSADILFAAGSTLG